MNIANSCFQVSTEAFWKLQNLENSSVAGAPLVPESVTKLLATDLAS